MMDHGDFWDEVSAGKRAKPKKTFALEIRYDTQVFGKRRLRWTRHYASEKARQQAAERWNKKGGGYSAAITPSLAEGA